MDLCLVSSLPSVTTTHVANVLAEIGPRDLKCIALPASKEGVLISLLFLMVHVCCLLLSLVIHFAYCCLYSLMFHLSKPGI